MQVELVNHRLTDFDSSSNAKIDIYSHKNLAAVYDDKEKNKQN